MDSTVLIILFKCESINPLFSIAEFVKSPIVFLAFFKDAKSVGKDSAASLASVINFILFSRFSFSGIISAN